MSIKEKIKLNKNIIKTLFLIIVLALPMLSAGCGGKTVTAPVTLTIWKPFVDSDKMQDLISAYEAKHRNVTIQYTKKNIENYQSDLLNAMASGNGPDIFSINNSWVPSYLDKISPAPDNVFTVREYKDTFVDSASSDLIVDNKIYGTAMWVDSLALYYNKDLLGTAGIATPPKTWKELAEDVRLITRQNSSGYFDRSGVAMGTNANVNRGVDIVYLLMLQAGAVPWKADGSSPTFANSISKNGSSVNPGVEALSFYTSFADPYSANYTWNNESDYSTDAFANGRAAYLYGYYYTKDTINSKAPNLNYDVAPVPQYNLSDPNVNYSNYFAEVVSKQSKEQAWAWDFLKFASSKEALELYYQKDKEPSSRRDIIEEQSGDESVGVFAHANLTGKTFYKSDEAKFDGIMGDMIDNVILKGQTISQALNQAQSQAGTIARTRQQ